MGLSIQDNLAVTNDQKSPCGLKPPPSPRVPGDIFGGRGRQDRSPWPGWWEEAQLMSRWGPGLPKANRSCPKPLLEEERGLMALSWAESLLYDPGFVSESSSTYKGIQRFLVSHLTPGDFCSYLHIFALTVPLSAGPSFIHSPCLNQSLLLALCIDFSMETHTHRI